MLDRTLQPLSSKVTFDVSALPDTHILPNGVKLYSIRVSPTELVRVDFMFGGGQWIQHHPLQAGMVYSLMKEATRHIPHEQIAEKLDFYGAVIDSAVNMSYGRIGVTCLKKHLPDVLPIVLDMVQHPVFSPDRLALALSKAKVSYDVSMQTVGEQCKRLFYKGMFESGHPMTLFPEPSSYAGLDIEHLYEYAQRNFRLNNCTVFVTSDLDALTIEKVSSRLMQMDIERQSLFDGFEPLGNFVPSQRRFFHKMENSTVQACLRMGCRTIGRSHPDYVPLMVLTTLFGGYFGSRLMSNIRESKGYTYDISSSLFQTPQTALLSVKTETSGECVDKVVEEVYREMDILANQLVSESELNQVKNYILGYMCRAYENTFNLPLRLMNLHSNGLELCDIVSEAKRVDTVTPDDILSACQRYYNPSDIIECVAM